MASRPGITDGPCRPPGTDVADTDLAGIDLASPEFWRRPAGDRLEAFRRLRSTSASAPGVSTPWSVTETW